MNHDHMGYISKLGISITTLSTVSLILLNRAFYTGYFSAFGVSAGVISVDMKDLLSPKYLIMEYMFCVLLGYLIIFETKRNQGSILNNEGISTDSATASAEEDLNSQKGQTLFAKKWIYLALLYLVGFLIWTLFFTQNWSALFITGFLVSLGMMLYFSLGSPSVGKRVIYSTFIIGFILNFIVIVGYTSGMKSPTQATFITQNGKVIKDSRYIYANSQTYFVMEKGEDKTLTGIPRSQVQEVSIYKNK